MLKRVVLSVFLLGLGVTALPIASAQTIYKKKYENVKLMEADRDVTGAEALDHPHTFPPEKIYNMLGSLYFDKGALILNDKENIRLFDKRGLQLLSPYLVEAFAQATPEQVVSFTYIKKAPHWRVFRNDRLISGVAFVRNGELLIKFRKLYAEVFGDYQRPGQDRLLYRAKDVRVSLHPKAGQRQLGAKFIALKVDHDYRADLERLAAEEKAAKKAAEEAEMIKGVPLPNTGAEQAPNPSSNESISQNSDPDAAARLETLEELRKKKLISEAEYQRKRREIIGEI